MNAEKIRNMQIRAKALWKLLDGMRGDDPRWNKAHHEFNSIVWQLQARRIPLNLE